MCFFYLQVAVGATDNRIPEKQTFTTVNIRIEIDASDPVFIPPNSNFAFRTEETNPSGHIIGRVTGSDADLRGTIIYETDGETPADYFFNVNRTTGEIYIMRNLKDDIQAREQYTVRT